MFVHGKSFHACIYHKGITIVNEDSRVISRWRSKLWCHFLTTLDVSFILLVSPIMLLENIYSTSITHDYHHIFIVQAIGFPNFKEKVKGATPIVVHHSGRLQPCSRKLDQLERTCQWQTQKLILLGSSLIFPTNKLECLSLASLFNLV